jgi:multiple sugar transport system permease protein
MIIARAKRRSAVVAPSRQRSKIDWSAYLYILPAGLLLGVFGLWPIVFGFWISLWRWGISPERFVGLRNYQRILIDDIVTKDYRGHWTLGEVGQSLVATIYYVIGTVPLSIGIAFVVAYLLFEGTPLRDFLRTIYFLPYVTSAVAAGMVFLWIFDPQIGVANYLFHALGLPVQTWLQDPDPVGKRFFGWLGLGWGQGIPDFAAGPSVAMVVVILFSIWSSLGFDVAIYLAGMTAVSREVNEAAQIDGAGHWQRIWRVTLPLVSPTTFFLLVTSTIRSFQAFTPIFVLSGGGFHGQAGQPLGTTRVLTVDIFYNFYNRPDSVGYAAGVAFVLLMCVLLLTLVQFRTVGRRAFYG